MIRELANMKYKKAGKKPKIKITRNHKNLFWAVKFVFWIIKKLESSPAVMGLVILVTNLAVFSLTVLF